MPVRFPWFHPTALSQTIFLALVVLFFLPTSALAQTTPDLGQMFANFSNSAVQIMYLVRWTAFVVGIAVASVGVMKFKEYSESGGRVKLSAPIILTFVGASLIALPGMIDTATETLSLGSNTATTLLAEPSVGDIPGFNAAIKGVLLFVKLIGHLAFFRGLLILKGIGEGQNGRVGLGGALIHIFGGAAAININATIAMLGATFAPGMDLGGLGG